MSKALTKIEQEIPPEDFGEQLAQELSEIVIPEKQAHTALAEGEYNASADDYLYDAEGNLIGIALKIQDYSSATMTWATTVFGKFKL